MQVTYNVNGKLEVEGSKRQRRKRRENSYVRKFEFCVTSKMLQF